MQHQQCNGGTSYEVATTNLPATISCVIWAMAYIGVRIEACDNICITVRSIALITDNGVMTIRLTKAGTKYCAHVRLLRTHRAHNIYIVHVYTCSVAGGAGDTTHKIVISHLAFFFTRIQKRAENPTRCDFPLCFFCCCSCLGLGVLCVCADDDVHIFMLFAFVCLLFS